MDLAPVPHELRRDTFVLSVTYALENPITRVNLVRSWTVFRLPLLDRRHRPESCRLNERQQLLVLGVRDTLVRAAVCRRGGGLLDCNDLDFSVLFQQESNHNETCVLPRP
jgi:hypothetical protein